MTDYNRDTLTDKVNAWKANGIDEEHIIDLLMQEEGISIFEAVEAV